jgi:hypothetical protein
MEALIIKETNAFINVNKTKFKGVFVFRETEQSLLFLLTESKTNKMIYKAFLLRQTRLFL